MVVHAHYPLAEPRVQREARAARDAGFHVTVLALRAPGEARKEQVDGISVRRLSVRHVRGGSFGRMMWEYLSFCLLASVWLALRAVRRPFQIVHVHNPPDFLVLAGLIPRWRGSRLVLDIHDLSSHIFAARFRGALGAIVSRMLIWIERLACRAADAVVTVHEPYRDELVRRGVSASRITVVMNSVDQVVLDRARHGSSIAPSSRGFRVAYHGTLTWWYGADAVIQALARLVEDGVDAEALLVGAGDAVPHLIEEVRSADLEERVVMSGRYLPIEDALASIVGSACGVIPNRPSLINRFALSSKLFEYIALGIPVVVARLETLAAHFSEDEVTFFEPGNVADLHRALRWVHDHSDEAGAKAQRARIRADEYSWSENRGRLHGLYHDLTGEVIPSEEAPLADPIPLNARGQALPAASVEKRAAGLNL
jgi:glycosyltransferase involved in cell wall biosynthesis